MRFKQFLNVHAHPESLVEAFDKPYDYHMRKKRGNYLATFNTDEGDPVDVHFEPYQSPDDEVSWEIEFTRGGSQSVTGEGDAMRIFATVMDIIKKFIAKEKPKSMTFSAIKTDEDYEAKRKSSREKLYLRMVKKYVKGYKVDMRTSRGGSTFYLTKVGK